MTRLTALVFSGLLLFAAASPGQAQTAVYTASGPLAGGASWSATLTFDVADQADLMITLGEIFTLEAQTFGDSFGNVAAIYDTSELLDIGTGGFAFDSASLGADITGVLPGISFDFVTWSDTTTSQQFSIGPDLVNETIGPSRGLPQDVEWVFVPEPASVVLLGLSGLLVTRRRHGRAN